LDQDTDTGVQDRFKVLPTIRIGENLLAKVIAAQPTLTIQAIRPKSRNDFRQRRLARLDQFPGELIGIDNGYSLPREAMADFRFAAANTTG